MSVTVHAESKHSIARDLDHDFITARIDSRLWNDVLHTSVFLITWYTILVGIRSTRDGFRATSALCRKSPFRNLTHHVALSPQG